jgi:cholesterol transport system auxiliary component
MKRRAALVALAALAALAGCAVLDNNKPTPTYFVLRDTGTATPAAQRLPRVLLVAPSGASPFYDTQSIVFSRAPGTRAYYQFAAWTERPGKRFDSLLLARLEQRAAFAAVATSVSGVRGDLLLAPQVLEIYHDDRQAPGVVRVVVSAELTDARQRAIVARRTFTQEAAVAEENAAAAVRAFDAAVTRLLDEMVAWVEGEAAARRQP